MVISTPVRNNLNEDIINQLVDIHFYISELLLHRRKNNAYNN